MKSILLDFLKLESASGILVGSMILVLPGPFILRRALAAEKSDNTLVIGDGNA